MCVEIYDGAISSTHGKDRGREDERRRIYNERADASFLYYFGSERTPNNLTKQKENRMVSRAASIAALHCTLLVRRVSPLRIIRPNDRQPRSNRRETKPKRRQFIDALRQSRPLMHHPLVIRINISETHRFEHAGIRNHHSVESAHPQLDIIYHQIVSPARRMNQRAIIYCTTVNDVIVTAIDQRSREMEIHSFCVPLQRLIGIKRYRRTCVIIRTQFLRVRLHPIRIEARRVRISHS